MEKPVCGRCGEAHWRFVSCAKAPEANLQEAANADQRARETEQAKVYPMWRGRDGQLQTGRQSWNTDFASRKPNSDPPQAA